jgi:hypothetical protein
LSDHLLRLGETLEETFVAKGGLMLHLDGSRFSGSGTIVRFGVPLAALTGQALHLTNIRARRAPQDSGPNICRRWKP